MTAIHLPHYIFGKSGTGSILNRFSFGVAASTKQEPLTPNSLGKLLSEFAMAAFLTRKVIGDRCRKK